MRSSADWYTIVHPAAYLGIPGELERVITRIQADAIRHAASIVRTLSPGTRSEDRAIALDEAVSLLLDEAANLERAHAAPLGVSTTPGLNLPCIKSPSPAHTVILRYPSGPIGAANAPDP